MNELNLLTQAERDELTRTLTSKQKQFIDELLKRGRRTVFANVLARDKASGSEEETMEEVARRWELLDYIDAGPDWRAKAAYYCECGRPLRYQYIVRNSKTGEVKKFGITHFEIHVGIPPHLVKQIVKGFETIDFERDEILIKIATNWSLAEAGIRNIPEELEIPSDVQLHFDYNVPLLDRQVRRLKQRVNDYMRNLKIQRLEQERHEKELNEKRKREVYTRDREAIRVKLGWGSKLNEKEYLELGIMIFLENSNQQQFLASEVSEELAAYHGASGERFSSGMLKIFPDVCMVLESLVKQQKLQFIKKQNGRDRVYRVITEES